MTVAELVERPEEVKPLLFNVQDGADYLGVSVWTLRGLISAGQISHTRIGRLIFVPRWALEEYANKGREGAGPCT